MKWKHKLGVVMLMFPLILVIVAMYIDAGWKIATGILALLVFISMWLVIAFHLLLS